MFKSYVIAATCLILSQVSMGETASNQYQEPSASLKKLVDAKRMPRSFLSPHKDVVVFATRKVFPSIEEMSQPQWGLAGIRVSPKNFAQANERYYQDFSVMKLSGSSNEVLPISDLPNNSNIQDLNFSPDGKSLAFTLTNTKSIELWNLNLRTFKAKQVAKNSLNGVPGKNCQWSEDSKGMYCLSTISGPFPDETVEVPLGPVIQENKGTKKPLRTFQDLLTNQKDEKKFIHYFTSQIIYIKLDGNIRKVGKPDLYKNFSISPDGKYIFVERLKKPFSYQVSYHRFPVVKEIWDTNGKQVKLMADLPLADNIPNDFDSVQTGKREFFWQDHAPNTICWVEALDGGDINKQADLRDQIACQKAPYTSKSEVLASLKARFQGIAFGEEGDAFIWEGLWKDRMQTIWFINKSAEARTFWSGSMQDRYNLPGNPLIVKNKYGRSVFYSKNGKFYLTGEGASKEGNRPFLDEYSVADFKKQRIWQSSGESYANVRDILGDDNKFLMFRETPSTPSQMYILDLENKKETQLTNYKHPVPELQNIKKELIKWKRKDGLELSGMLYYPGNFTPKKDKPLPVMTWVYPGEFKNKSDASQVNGSPYEFSYPWWGAAIFAVMQGYAVIDDPSFAIVGEGNEQPNDTYIEQLVDSASSMIDHVVEMGVGDRSRFAVGGHSYGAFTTANLLAHSDLFVTGMARSGAYNRTLTPFGFQAEERNYWEATDTYHKMSPFNYAHKINEPLLIIHGAADNNPGTYPMQSERLFQAMSGLGGKVRYVELPKESHSYRSRESVLHVLWEQEQWLKQNFKKE